MQKRTSFPAAKRGLGGARVQANYAIYALFFLLTLKWVVRVHTRISPAGLGSRRGRTPPKSRSHRAPVGVIESFDIESLPKTASFMPATSEHKLQQ